MEVGPTVEPLYGFRGFRPYVSIVSGCYVQMLCPQHFDIFGDKIRYLEPILGARVKLIFIIRYSNLVKRRRRDIPVINIEPVNNPNELVSVQDL